MRTKALILVFLFLSSTSTAFAQKGLYVRISLGPGYNVESSGINKSGMTLPTKNHALGWGINDKYALFISDFGGLIKQDVGEYSYINLDALGPGITWHTSHNFSVSLAVGQGTASFAKSWKEATGDLKGEGYAINFFVDKRWPLSKRFDVGLTPVVMFFKTQNDNYQFVNVGLNGFIEFHLTPKR